MKQNSVGICDGGLRETGEAGKETGVGEWPGGVCVLSQPRDDPWRLFGSVCAYIRLSAVRVSTREGALTRAAGAPPQRWHPRGGIQPQDCLSKDAIEAWGGGDSRPRGERAVHGMTFPRRRGGHAPGRPATSRAVAVACADAPPRTRMAPRGPSLYALPTASRRVPPPAGMVRAAAATRGVQSGGDEVCACR